MKKKLLITIFALKLVNCNTPNFCAAQTPCFVDTSVYLTNIAFRSDADAPLDGFVLPATMNYNSNNPNNFLDVNTPVRFKIECTNHKVNGQSIISGLCKIRTNDSNITLIDSTAGLNNVSWNGTAWSTDEFEIKVSANITTSYTAYVDFVVVEGTNQFVTQCIPIPILPYTISTLTIDDDNNPDSHGNSNGIANPNEAIEVNPYINNTSIFDADLMYGKVYNYNAYTGINIWNNVQGISGTVYDGGWWNYSFGNPNSIPSGSTNMVSQYDFVFDYNYSSTYKIDLHVVTFSAFRIFGQLSNPALVLSTVKMPINTGFPNVPLIPIVTTAQVSSITSNSVQCGGTVTEIGESQVTERGICFSTNMNPTISNNIVTSGSGIGNFSAIVNGLIPNTTYHIKAYSTNIYGTSYGADISFTTQNVGIEEHVDIFDLKIYPNPINDEFVLEGNLNLVNRNYRIINLLGESISEGKIDGAKTRISISNCPKGLYFVTIEGAPRHTLKISKK